MWKNILFQMLISAVRQIVGSDLFDHIKELVAAYADIDMPGQQKKIMIHKRLDDIKGDLGDIARGTSQIFINLAIEAVLVSDRGDTNED